MKFFILSIAFICSFNLFAQDATPPTNGQLKSAPKWAKLMYEESSTIYTIDNLYKKYIHENGAVKNSHTRYYKFWRKSIKPRIANDGTIISIPAYEKLLEKELTKYNTKKKNTKNKKVANSGNWISLGPTEVYNENLVQSDSQFVASALDVSQSNPDIVYCGTQPGGVYKSLDGGDNWINVGFDLAYFNPTNDSMEVKDIAIHPTNSDLVFFSTARQIFRTTNGGDTWDLLYTLTVRFGLQTQKIFINPKNTDMILVASAEGLLRSDNNGDSWTKVFTNSTYDIAVHPKNNNIIYALRLNAKTKICEFIRSVNNGKTFTVQSRGWYTSTDPDRQVLGGRISVTPASPNMVYAFIIGQTKEGDKGQIGLFRSTNTGSKWTARGQIGGPYNGTDKKNLVTVLPNGSLFYGGLKFLDLAVSNTDPNKLLLGSLNLYLSEDGGLNFKSMGGYSGGILNQTPQRFHVDQKEIIQSGNRTWIGNDGGIYRSDDFFTTSNFTILSKGINSTDLWGFGMGWNKDIMISGVYHNGNIVMNASHPSKKGISLDGAEPSTGYVNPGDKNMVYSSEKGIFKIPDDINDTPIRIKNRFIKLNESVDQDGAISDLVFQPNCYSIAYVGKGNKLWRTEDKGITFRHVYTFGRDNDNEVSDIKISRENPNLFYVCQRLPDSNEVYVWKSIDAGQNWKKINLPWTSTTTHKAMIEVDPYNANNMWFINERNNAFDLFQTTNGGKTWTRINSSKAKAEFLSLNYIAGTDGGIYVGTKKGIYYKNNTMVALEAFNSGFPQNIIVNRVRPFYRDGELRTATRKGYWKSKFRDAPSRPYAQISVDKLIQTKLGEAFHFIDYSMLNHENATWEWTFEGGTPATSNNWEETVVFNSMGTHQVTLKITDGNGNVDTHTMSILGKNSLKNSLGTADTNNIDKDNISIYPNPIKPGEKLHVNTISEKEIDIKIFDTEGKILLKKTSKGSTQITVPNLSQGLYILTLSSDSFIRNEMIVIE